MKRNEMMLYSSPLSLTNADRAAETQFMVNWSAAGLAAGHQPPSQRRSPGGGPHTAHTMA